MARRNGAVGNLTELEAETKRLEELNARRRAALEEKARVLEIENDLKASQEQDMPSGAPQILEAPPAATVSEVKTVEEVVAQLTAEEGGRFEVYRVVGGLDRKVGSYPIGDYPSKLDLIAAELNATELRVKFRCPNTGQVLKQTTHYFEPKAQGATDTVANGGNGADMARILEAMERRDAQYRQDMREMQERMFNLQLKMVENAGQNNGFIKSAQDMKALMEVMGESKKPSTMESLRDFIECVNMFKSGEVVPTEPRPPWMEAIDKVFQMVKPLIEVGAAKLAGGLASARPPMAALTGPEVTPSSGVRAVPTAPASSGDVEMQRIKVHAQTLLEAATKGLTPSSVAAFIVENIKTEEDEKQVRFFATDPGIVSTLIMAEPRLIPYQAWLAQMVMTLREEVGPEEIPTAQVPPAPVPVVLRPQEDAPGGAQGVPIAPTPGSDISQGGAQISATGSQPAISQPAKVADTPTDVAEARREDAKT
jgi:hypothetical protein